MPFCSLRIYAAALHCFFSLYDILFLKYIQAYNPDYECFGAEINMIYKARQNKWQTF